MTLDNKGRNYGLMATATTSPAAAAATAATAVESHPSPTTTTTATFPTLPQPTPTPSLFCHRHCHRYRHARRRPFLPGHLYHPFHLHHHQTTYATIWAPPRELASRLWKFLPCLANSSNSNAPCARRNNERVTRRLTPTRMCV